MKFTPKSYVVPIICGVLIIAPTGRNKANDSKDTATVAVQNASATSKIFETNGDISITPAVERIPLAGAQIAAANDFSTVAWYKNKHWWKKNAPIIGGAAGGGLIGGLAGGGAGAVIGGAAGAGGGALYKHYKGHHSHHHDTQYRTNHSTQNHYEQSNPGQVKR
jgi:hypothetical protein